MHAAAVAAIAISPTDPHADVQGLTIICPVQVSLVDGRTVPGLLCRSTDQTVRRVIICDRDLAVIEVGTSVLGQWLARIGV